MAVSFLGEPLDPDTAAHCRLKTGRDEATADLAFEDEDELLDAKQADPIADVGKSGRVAAPISGKSQWIETDGGIAASILEAIFQPAVKTALAVLGRNVVTFGSQQAKYLSRLLVFHGQNAMADVPMTRTFQARRSHDLNFAKLSDAQQENMDLVRDTLLREWVAAGRAHIDERNGLPNRRKVASYDITDDELYDTLSQMDLALQPDVLKEFFRQAAEVYNIGPNSLFNGIKGFQGLVQLMISTEHGGSSSVGSYTGLGEPAEYLGESMKILSQLGTQHGRVRRKKEKESKAARPTGYYLANISAVRAHIFQSLVRDLDNFYDQLTAKVKRGSSISRGIATPLMSVLEAGQLRGAVVAALQTSSPPLRIGAYMHLTQLAALRAIITYNEEQKKNEQLALEKGLSEDDTEETIVYLPVEDKTSAQWGQAGIKVDYDVFMILVLWLFYGRRCLGPTVSATTIPQAVTDGGRVKMKMWCDAREQEPSYTVESDALFPTVNGLYCDSLSQLTAPIYNHYMSLRLNATDVRRYVTQATARGRGQLPMGWVELDLRTVTGHLICSTDIHRSYIDAGRRWASTSAGEEWRRSRGVERSPDNANHFVADLCAAQGHSLAQQVSLLEDEESPSLEEERSYCLRSFRLTLSQSQTFQERAYLSRETLMHLAMQESERFDRAVAAAPTRVATAGGGILLDSSGRLTSDAPDRLLATSRIAESEEGRIKS